MGRTGENLGTAYASIELDSARTRQGADEIKGIFGGLVSNITSQLGSIGGQISAVGNALTGIATPIAGGFALATKGAVDFDETLKNIQSVTFKTTEEMDALRAGLMGVAEDARYGPEQLALAMYDIAGGVQDATTHMAILDAAVKTAQAGNADLAGTTSGLISVMNAYDMGVEDAARLSDIFVKTVGMGVGTMDEFTAALGPASGLAFDLGISFEELAASTSFLTSTGATASEATTQLTGVMSAFLKPNADMEKALMGMGYESGTAAIKALGLQGAVRALHKTVGSTDEMAKALGAQEALGGAIGLLSERSQEFTETFMESMDGAADAAETIQMESAAAQMDVLMSNVQSLGIEVGTVLLPVLIDLVKEIKPVVQSIIQWVKENPQLVATVGKIAVVLGALGPVLAVVGGAISGVGALIAALTSPIALIVAAVAGLALAFHTNFLGIRDAVQPILDEIGRIIQDTVIPALQSMYTWFVEDALPAIVNFVQGTVVPAIQGFFQFIADAWAIVSPALTSLADWFLNSALPAIQSFITGTVIPAIQSLIDFFIKLWNDVSPFLLSLLDWFINTGMPLVVDFINNVVVPAVQKIVDVLSSIWTTVQPTLQSLYDWFVTSALPFVVDFLNNVVTPAVQALIDILAGMWTVISPVVDLFKTGIETAFNFVKDMVINPIIGVIDQLIKLFEGIWTAVQQPLEDFKKGIEGVFNWIKTNVIDPIIARINEFTATLQSVGDFMGNLDQTGKGAGGLFGSGIGPDFDPIGGIRGIGRDQGGRGLPGNVYAIGIGAQPEYFVPDQRGTFHPRGEGLDMGGGTTVNATINIPPELLASIPGARAAGEAMADAFGGRMTELMRQRG